MKFFWSWVGMALLAGMAGAAELGVLDLRLHPEDAWSRGTPEQEREDDALMLQWPDREGVALQVLVPQNPPLLKSDAETFYRHLKKKWAALYGKAAAMGWADLGGRRWLVCRRPSREGAGMVFHLATAHEGRGYSVLVFAPEGVEALPRAAQDLVSGASFQAPALQWRLARSVALMPQGEALSALAQAESDALGEGGMLTGYAFRALPQDFGLEWELEGFLWTHVAGRDERTPLRSQGRLSLSPPPVLEGPVQVVLNLAASAVPISVKAALYSYCGPPEAWKAALSALERGARAPLARLARDHACPGGVGASATWEAFPGEPLIRTLELTPTKPGEGSGPRWLEATLAPPPGAVGEGLLGRLGLVLVYEPE